LCKIATGRHNSLSTNQENKTLAKKERVKRLAFYMEDDRKGVGKVNKKSRTLLILLFRPNLTL